MLRDPSLNTSNVTDCTEILWSDKTIRSTKSLFYICTVAALSHVLFRIQLQVFPIERKRSMLWVHAYLTTHLLIMIRFFLLYVYRWWPRCVFLIFRSVFCYGEALVDGYLNILQSYFLLALNISRYVQIVHNHNVYVFNHRLVRIVHRLIYFVPLFGSILTIQFGWIIVQSLPGDTCNLLPVSLAVKIVFLCVSYVMPVTLMLLFLSFCLGHIRNVTNIKTKQIMYLRHKYHRQLVRQSCIFYSLWILLWSPSLLVFPFFHKYSTVSMIAQKLNYTNITLDPFMIIALDIRYLQVWRSTVDSMLKCIRHRRHQTTETSITQSLTS